MERYLITERMEILHDHRRYVTGDHIWLEKEAAARLAAYLRPDPEAAEITEDPAAAETGASQDPAPAEPPAPQPALAFRKPKRK